MNHDALSIAAFGSWRSPHDQRVNEAVQGASLMYQHNLSHEDFQTACRQLGAEVAEFGHRIFVASDSPSTIDYHVVQGILERANRHRLSHSPIMLVRSVARRSNKGNEDCSKIYDQLLRTRPGLFEVSLDLQTNTWEEVHDYISGRSDRILILGGGASSHRIAVRALAVGKLVVPIGTFGGAGEEITRMLENVRDDRNFPKYEYRKVLASDVWTDAQLNTALYALGLKADPQKRHKIFINYRRTDSNIAAAWIYKDLCSAFSSEVVFLDTESIPAGDHFNSVIVSALSLTRTFVCVIGPEWLTAMDERSGQRRLDVSDDFVRREIEIALQDGLRVIPVCVEGAGVPAAANLPQSIAKLTEFNAHFVSFNRIGEDITSLVSHIKKLMDQDLS